VSSLAKLAFRYFRGGPCGLLSQDAEPAKCGEPDGATSIWSGPDKKFQAA